MTNGRLAGRVALVTGGASGMGLATARRFLTEGAAVVVADLNEANGASFMESAREQGCDDRARFVRVDVAEEAEVEHAVSVAMTELGGLDVVFNNAGVGGAFGPVTEIEVDDWDYTFAVLCRGVFLGVKHGARAMRDTGSGGSIINTASIAGLSGGAGPLAYSAAKAAVINLTKSAAVELAPSRIRVNAICPGAILTPLAIGKGDPERVAQHLDSVQPWPEHGTGDDIAAVALFLASDESRFVSGEAIVVDGGLTADGPGLTRELRIDAGRGGFVGVNRGTTGEAATVRRRVETGPGPR